MNEIRNYTMSLDPQHPTAHGMLRLALDSALLDKPRRVYQPVTIEPRILMLRVIREEGYGARDS